MSSVSNNKSNDGPTQKRHLVMRNTAIMRASLLVNLKNSSTAGTSLTDEEHRLGDQYRYFRQEFINAAHSADVTVPLDILEDNTGRVYSFVKYNGPKYIFQVMMANIDHMHLLRTAISLLIVSVTIIRRRLPVVDGGVKPTGWMSSMNDKINLWASDSLHQIADNAAISVCINLLILSPTPSVQELTLGLIAILVSVSDEALMQMFETPNTLNQKVSKTQDRSLRHRIASEKSSTSKRGMSTLSMQLSTGNLDSSSLSRLSRKFSLGGAATPIDRRLSSLQPSGLNSSNPAEDPPEESQLKAIEIVPGSCLSLMLSTCKLYKSRHAIIGRCGEVITGMCSRNHSYWSAEEVADAIARTPTCSLPNTSSSSAPLQSRKSKVGKVQSSPLGGSDREESNQLMDPDGWAGIKLPMKFLARFLKFDAGSGEFSAPAFQDPELFATFCKVLSSVSLLICQSLSALMFVKSLPNSAAIISTARGKCREGLSEDSSKAIDSCLMMLEKIDIQEKEARLSTRGSIRRSKQGKQLVHVALSAGRNLSSQASGSQKKSEEEYRLKLTRSLGGMRSLTRPKSPQLVLNELLTESLNEAKSSNETLTAHSFYTQQSGGVWEVNFPTASESSGMGDFQLPESSKRPTTSPMVMMRSAPSSAASQHVRKLKSSVHSSRNNLDFEDDDDDDNQVKCLAKDFFGRLPSVPVLPPRIESPAMEQQVSLASQPQQSIMSNSGTLMTSLLPKLQQQQKLEAIQGVAFKKLIRDGGHLNGKNTISIEERARRVYSPARSGLDTPGGSRSKVLGLMIPNEFDAPSQAINHVVGISETTRIKISNRPDDGDAFLSLAVAGLQLDEDIFYDHPKLMEDLQPIYRSAEINLNYAMDDDNSLANVDGVNDNVDDDDEEAFQNINNERDTSAELQRDLDRMDKKVVGNQRERLGQQPAKVHIHENDPQLKFPPTKSILTLSSLQEQQRSISNILTENSDFQFS